MNNFCSMLIKQFKEPMTKDKALYILVVGIPPLIHVFTNFLMGNYFAVGASGIAAFGVMLVRGMCYEAPRKARVGNAKT